MQEETTALGIPCMTIRDNTERPITIEKGTNILAGTSEESIRNAFELIMKNKNSPYDIPEFWDGNAAHRIIKIIKGSVQ